MGVTVLMLYKMIWGGPVGKKARPDNANSVVPIESVSEPLAVNPTDLQAELEWIRFRDQTLGPAAYSEAPASKLIRKIKENPFVPIGATATLGALTYGLWCFRQGRARDSQMMMRARILAQGFTIVALMSGVIVEGTKGIEKGLKGSK